MLWPAEWLLPRSHAASPLPLPSAPPTPAKVLRLPVVGPLPCTSCDERHRPGQERQRLGQQLRELKSRDFERALRGSCGMPCALLEARLDPANPCKGCFHRDAKTCKSACYVLERLLPRAAPSYYDEVPVRDAVLEIRAPEADDAEPDDSRWYWADFADEKRSELQRAMEERLTEPQRQALELYLDGLNGVQTAKALGKSKVTVFWLWKRAMRHLNDFFHGVAPRRSRCHTTAASARADE